MLPFNSICLNLQNQSYLKHNWSLLRHCFKTTSIVISIYSPHFFIYRRIKATDSLRLGDENLQSNRFPTFRRWESRLEVIVWDIAELYWAELGQLDQGLGLIAVVLETDLRVVQLEEHHIHLEWKGYPFLRYPRIYMDLLSSVVLETDLRVVQLEEHHIHLEGTGYPFLRYPRIYMDFHSQQSWWPSLKDKKN